MESHIGSQLGEIPTTQMEIIEKLLQIKDEIKEEFDKFRARMKNWAEAIPNSTIAGSQSLSINEDPTHGKAYNVLVVGACESEDKAYKVFEEMSHPISIVTTETQGDEDVADKDGDDVLGLSDVEGNLIHEAQKDDQSKGDKLESTKIIYPMAAQGAWLPLIHLQPVLSSEGEGTVNVSATGSPKAWIGESTPELKIVLGKNVMEIDALKVLDKLTEPIQTEESNGGQFISDLPIYVNGNDSYEQLRLDGDAHKVFDQFSPSFRAVRLDEQTYINGIKGAWERFLFDPGGRFLPQMCCDLLELNGEHEDYCLELAASVVDKITAIKNVSESKVSKEIDEGHTMEKQQDESRVASAEDQGEKHATAVVAGGSEQGLSFMEKFDKIGRCTLLVCTSPPHSESNVCGLYIKLSSVNSNEEIYGNNDFLSSFSHILGLNNVDKINWQNDGFYNSLAYEEIVMRYSLAKVYMVDLCFHQCNVYGKYALNFSRGILHPVIRKAHGTCISKVVSSLRHALSTILPGDKHCLMASNHFHIYCSGSHLILALIFDRITHGKDSAVMVLITLSEKANSELLMVILSFDPGGFCWPQMGSDPFEGNGEKGEFGYFVKMIHNRIEYDDVQLIEKNYDIIHTEKYHLIMGDSILVGKIAFVYILEDKDIFEKVGRRIIPMVIQLASICCVIYSSSKCSWLRRLENEEKANEDSSTSTQLERKTDEGSDKYFEIKGGYGLASEVKYFRCCVSKFDVLLVLLHFQTLVLKAKHMGHWLYSFINAALDDNCWVIGIQEPNHCISLKSFKWNNRALDFDVVGLSQMRVCYATFRLLVHLQQSISSVGRVEQTLSKMMKPSLQMGLWGVQSSSTMTFCVQVGLVIWPAVTLVNSKENWTLIVLALIECGGEGMKPYDLAYTKSASSASLQDLFVPKISTFFRKPRHSGGIWLLNGYNYFEEICMGSGRFSFHHLEDKVVVEGKDLS